MVGSGYVRKKELKNYVKESEWDLQRQQQQTKIHNITLRVEDHGCTISELSRELKKYRGLLDVTASQDQITDLFSKINKTVVKEDFDNLCSRLDEYCLLSDAQETKNTFSEQIEQLTQGLAAKAN